MSGFLSQHKVPARRRLYHSRLFYLQSKEEGRSDTWTHDLGLTYEATVSTPYIKKTLRRMPGLVIPNACKL